MLEYKQQLNLSNICLPIRKKYYVSCISIFLQFFYVTKKNLDGGDNDNDGGWRRKKMTCRKREKVCELVRVGL